MICVRPASGIDERRTALSLLIHGTDGHKDAEEVTASLQASGMELISLQGLLAAEAAGRLVGSILLVPQQDGSALVWPPGGSSASCAGTGAAWEDVADALLRAACEQLGQWHVRYSQALVEPEQESVRNALVRFGFAHLADLSYRQRLLTEPLPPGGSRPLEFDLFDPASEQSVERLAGLLERTYVESLDCPGFVSERTGREAIESHRMAGGYRPEWFRIYRQGESDVGVLLLVEHSDQRACELAYVGLIPEARGQGLCFEMVLEGLRLARDAGCESMLLGVDSRNCYALAVYERLGFREMTRRAVYLRMNRPGSVR